MIGGVRAEGYTKTRARFSKEDIFDRSNPRGKSDRIVRHISGYYQLRIRCRQTEFSLRLHSNNRRIRERRNAGAPSPAGRSTAY